MSKQSHELSGMASITECVRQFMKLCNHEVRYKTITTVELNDVHVEYVNGSGYMERGDIDELRVRLIEEEVRELRSAVDNCNIVEMADALGDLLYVVVGAAITWGIPLGAVFDEIHRSNMTKVVQVNEGNYAVQYRSDGKVLKPETYSPPDIKGVLKRYST